MSTSHLGLNFSAHDALRKSSLQVKQHKTIYDRILRQCLDRIRALDRRQKSIIFDVPERMPMDYLAYDVEEATQYLITALVDDRKFIVIRIPRTRKLYITWHNAVLTNLQRRPTFRRDDMEYFIPDKLPSVVDAWKDQTAFAFGGGSGKNKKEDEIDVDDLLQRL